MSTAFNPISLSLIVGSGIGTFFILQLIRGQKQTLSKNRLSRVGRTGESQANKIADAPSILREHANFLRSQKSNGSTLGLWRWVAQLDNLTRSSNSGISARGFIILVLLFSFFVALVGAMLLKSHFIILLFISTPSVFLFAVHLLNIRRRRELRRFQEVFPEALDLIVRSVRAGLPVSEAIKVIATEVAPPVNLAFREVADHLAIGMSLEEALANLQKKAALPEVKFFSISLSIQQETGGNLAEILANLASIMRKRVQISKKIRALSSEARASALIIGSLPFLVGIAIFILNRDYIEVLIFHPTGQILLFSALGSILCGALVIRKLIRFDI